MLFRRKSITPVELGRLLYRNIYSAIIEADSPLNHLALLNQLEEDADNLPLDYILEIFMGALFGALISVEKHYEFIQTREIMDSAITEFVSRADLIAEIEKATSKNQHLLRITERFKEYQECLSNNDGAGLSWHMGKKFYWNLVPTGFAIEDPGPPIVCATYFAKFVKLTDQILKAYKIQGVKEPVSSANLKTSIIFGQGLFEIVGLGSFLYGYFSGVNWLMVVGGCLVIVDDLIEMFLGILNPLFPVIVAVVLAIIFKPWYVGVFWGSAAFKILGMPGMITKLITPHKIAQQAILSSTDRPL